MAQKVFDIPNTKNLKVYVQGNLDDRIGKTFFLSLHDVGSNARPFLDFVDSVSMTEVKKKSIWLHVVLPGQEDDDPALPSAYNFPTLNDVATNLAIVLDFFNVKNTIIGFGEGAGSNILLRFSLIYPNRCLGLILIDCTACSAGFDEQVLCKMYNWKENGAKLWNKVVSSIQSEKLDSKPLTNRQLNRCNVGRYFDTYLKRDDLSEVIHRDLNTDAVLITGGRSSYVQDAYHLNRLKCYRSTVLILDDKADVITEATMNVARALILFCKGVGVLTSVPLLGLEKEFRRIQDKDKRPMTEKELQLARTIQAYEDWVDFVA